MKKLKGLLDILLRVVVILAADLVVGFSLYGLLACEGIGTGVIITAILFGLLFTSVFMAVVRSMAAEGKVKR